MLVDSVHARQPLQPRYSASVCIISMLAITHSIVAYMCVCIWATWAEVHPLAESVNQASSPTP